MPAPLALALSPHLDDAAFSCGGLLASLGAAGWRVVVATVFTATVPEPKGFALACQTDKGLDAGVDYMALRRAEDEAACAALGAEPRHLPFAEAPHRGYDSAAALFADPREDDPVVGALAPALRDLLDGLAPALLLAPQAVGGHVDHVQLLRALRPLVGARPALWWRDFPYSVREAAPAEPFAADFAALPAREVALTGASRAAKAAACAAYASQLGFQFGGPDGLTARLAAEAAEAFRARGPVPALPGAA